MFQSKQFYETTHNMKIHMWQSSTFPLHFSGQSEIVSLVIVSLEIVSCC